MWHYAEEAIEILSYEMQHSRVIGGFCSCSTFHSDNACSWKILPINFFLWLNKVTVQESIKKKKNLRGKVGWESSALDTPIYRLFNIACCSLSASAFTSSWHANLKPILKRKEDIYLKESLLTSNHILKKECLRIEKFCSIFDCKYIISLCDLLRWSLCHIYPYHKIQNSGRLTVQSTI